MENKETTRYRLTETTPEEQARYAAEAAAMTRAYRARGLTMPVVGCLTSLLLCLLVPVWYGVTEGRMTPWAALGLGVLLSLFAIPLHLLGGADAVSAGWARLLFYTGSMTVNALGTSLCMTAYYIHLGRVPTPSAIAATAAVAAGLYVLVCILMQALPDSYGAITGIAALVTVGLLVACVVFWVRSGDKALFSLLFFNFVWVLITVIALRVACSDEGSPWLRFSSYASFGLLMVVAAVVLLILLCAGGDGCDCDCGDGCGDCCDCGGGGEKRPRDGHRGRRPPSLQ
jgi:hypothetical protein